MLRGTGGAAAAALARQIVSRPAAPHRVTRAPARLQHLLRLGLAAARVRAGNRRLLRSTLAGSVRNAARMMRPGLLGALARARARIAARRTSSPRAPVRARMGALRYGTARRLF